MAVLFILMYVSQAVPWKLCVGVQTQQISIFCAENWSDFQYRQGDSVSSLQLLNSSIIVFWKTKKITKEKNTNNHQRKFCNAQEYVYFNCML